MCSESTTRAAGVITRMAVGSKRGPVNRGNETTCSAATLARSTRPSTKASAYPPNTASRIGITARKPRNSSEPKMARASVVSPMAMSAGTRTPLASGNRPAIPAATLPSSRPIRATMGPMAAGGRTMSSQRVPAQAIRPAARAKTTPAAMKPPRAREKFS